MTRIGDRERALPRINADERGSGKSKIPAEIRFLHFCRKLDLALTALESGSAWPGAAAAWVREVAVADRRLQGLSLVMRALRSPRLGQAALAATLSQSACAGTSGRAAPPNKQRTQQSRPSASGLPVAAGRRRPCWSGAFACRTQ